MSLTHTKEFFKEINPHDDTKSIKPSDEGKNLTRSCSRRLPILKLRASANIVRHEGNGVTRMYLVISSNKVLVRALSN